MNIHKNEVNENHKNVMPRLTRFFYLMIYTIILGFSPTFQGYFESILINASQASNAVSGI